MLHPPSTLVPGVAPEANENSVVLKISKGEFSLLLCGDLEEGAISGILAWGDALTSTILKVPHHGSALGPREAEFFTRVHPAWSIISVGRLHHLPAADTLAGLEEAGARVLMTRDAGAVIVRIDAGTMHVTTVRNVR